MGEEKVTKGAREERLNGLRERLRELAEEMKRIRDEYTEARSRDDHDLETVLIRRETDVFTQVNEVVAEFAELMRLEARAP